MIWRDANGNDLGNLTLNTATLSYSNLYDNDEAKSIGIGMGISGRTGGASGNNINGTGNIALNY